ncbi:MAG TPA: EMC3/TMCO1 family protein [Methanomassiliicoccales archaeon]|nr:EMC3/TMCO1 family protein [Methanomassiliicoccales archaeon]
MAEKITAAPAPLPPRPGKPSSSTFITIMVLGLAMMILFDNNLRLWLGGVVGEAFLPIVGFGHELPILTLVITGMIMTLLTILIRHFMTDYVSQAEGQKIVSAYNKELRQARKDNNSFKLKKLLELQPKIMTKSMEQTKSQFKLLPISMLIVIPIFAWLDVFVRGLASPYYSVPWSDMANFMEAYLFPEWILVYTLVTIPFGQVLARLLRYISFKKRLDELVAQGK